MLRIYVSKTPYAAVRYLDDELSQQQYFDRSALVEARIEGKGAKILGIEGHELTRKTFDNLAHNINPVTGEKLTVRKVDNARAGYEYTFNAVKSVSLAFAITRDDAILEAHRSAVKAAMDEIEADMQTQANRNGQKYYETTGNIIYGRYDHFLARPNEEVKNDKRMYVPDCHLHTHAFVFNTTYTEKKSRWQAIEASNIHRVASYYEALYHSHLAKGLREAGYQIRKTPERFEIQGISRTMIEKFSNRTKTIEDIAKSQGIVDPNKKAQIGPDNRHKKDKSVPENQLYAIWRDRLSPKELEAIQTLKSSTVRDGKSISAREAVQRSLDHHLERLSIVPEKKILGHALTYGYGKLTHTMVKEAMAKRQDIIGADFNTLRYITTREVLNAESNMIRFASEGKGTQARLNANYEPKQDFLNEQQKRAIKKILTSRDRVQILMGAAGVGKTSLLSEIKNALAEKNKPLFACAPSAEASRGVLKQKGFEYADTIAALIHNKEHQDKIRNGVLLVDEASMVGVKTMNKIFKIAERQNARIILSGDTYQMQSVESGDAMRLIKDRSQVNMARVDTIVRQLKNEPYRRAIQAMARGETLIGYHKLDKLSAVKQIEVDADRHEQIASDYLESLQAKRSALVVCPTNREAEEITQVIRRKLVQSERITGKEKIFKNQRNLSWTEDQKKDLALYTEGMIVQFHQNSKGFVAGQKYEVVAGAKPDRVVIRSLTDKTIKPLPVEHHKNFNVFLESEISIAKGDTIRITNNGKTLEKTKINNGQTYSVKGFDMAGNIKLSNGKTLDKDYRNVTHAHVLTTHGAQGRDAKDVYLSMSSNSVGGINEKTFYVGASRGSERITIYTDDKEELRKAIVRNSDRMSASELADKAHKERLQRQARTNYYHEQNKELNRDGRSIPKNEKGLSKERNDRTPE